MTAYQVYQILNCHVADTDLQVEVKLRERATNVSSEDVDAVLAEHHAAQQLVKEMRF